ncbi:MAG: hypothetical protein ACYSR6_12255 [Planctomycetota bacterium]|jgi:glutamate-1-semialdehyde aminotransferase
MTKGRNARLYTAATKVIPGEVNSPVRAFKAVGGRPIFIERAKGPYLYLAMRIGKVSGKSKRQWPGGQASGYPQSLKSSLQSLLSGLLVLLKRSDTAGYGWYFTAMLKVGIYLPPSQFEACFVSTMRTQRHIAETFAAVRRLSF